MEYMEYMEYVPIRAFLFVQLINKSLREADYKHTPEMQLQKSKNPDSPAKPARSKVIIVN